MFDFDMLGLEPRLSAALAERGFKQPTPIQNQAIPLLIEGHDLLGLAQTGTGKTLAFGLPLIDGLLKNPMRPQPKSAKSLILAPTRELVNQIADNLKALTDGTKVRVVTVMGGQSINRQINALARGTDILVATPGRLIDLIERRAVKLDTVGYLVLDEADQMLDMGFIHALRTIEPHLGRPRQTMMFSATMPKQIEELGQNYLTNPRRLQVSPPGKAADKIEQSIHFLEKREKPSKLREILSADRGARTLVFARTKHGAEKLMKGLVADGFSAASIHGNKSQGQRDRAIAGFRDGSINILVATDVAARGIDIPDVAYVINYELPDVPDNFVHRIGRTARAGREGQAIALCCNEEVEQLLDIQKVMKITIPVASGEMPEPVDGPNKIRNKRGGGGRGGSQRGQGGRGGRNQKLQGQKQQGQATGKSKSDTPKSDAHNPRGPKSSGRKQAPRKDGDTPNADKPRGKLKAGKPANPSKGGKPRGKSEGGNRLEGSNNKPAAKSKPRRSKPSSRGPNTSLDGRGGSAAPTRENKKSG